MRTFPLLAVLTLSAAEARADLDAEANVPYRLRVPVIFESHSHFTPHFRRSLVRDVGSSLTAALGRRAGDVEAEEWRGPAGEDDPVMAAFEREGFGGLEAVDVLDGGKTHVLRVRYEQGLYVLEARQYDGSTGYATPLVRRRETRERALVGRLAALTIARDFGTVGTLAPAEPEAAEVEVTLKAGGIDGEPWVRRGDVFALVQIRDVAPRSRFGPPAEPQLQGFLVRGAYLQAVGDPQGGTVRCKMYFRHPGPLRRDARTAGFRCVKLGTTRGRVQIRVDSRDPGRAISPTELRVRLHQHGFIDPEKDSPQDEMALREGAFVSGRPYDDLAFARVMFGGRQVARVPVPVLEDGRVADVEVGLDPDAEKRVPLDRARGELLARIGDARLVQSRLFRDLNALVNAKKNEQALKRAEQGLAALRAGVEELSAESADLAAQANGVIDNADGFMTGPQRAIELLARDVGELDAYIDQNLRKVVEQENDPTVELRNKELNEKLARARLLRREFRVDDALKAYDEILAEQEQPMVRKEREALAARWLLRDDAHGKARQFVFETWAGLAGQDSANVESELPRAEQAFDKLQEVGDELTLRKMHLVNEQLLSELTERRDTLARSMQEEDEETLIALLDLLDRFARFHDSVNAHLASRIEEEEEEDKE